MKQIKVQTEKTLHALLAGTHPQAQKYGGKQVLVIDKEIVALKEKGLVNFKKLKAKYGYPPTLVFVPKPGASYILIFVRS